MSDVNKQLLDAVKHCHGIFDQHVSHHLAKPDYDKAAANERHRAVCAEAITAAEQSQQTEPVALVNAIQYLWQIIDDIDTYGDMAKSDDKLFRSLVEKRQKDRWKTGITTDGYVLTIPVGGQPAVAMQAQQSVAPCFVCGTAVYYKQHSDQDCACRDEFNGSAVLCQKCLASILRDQPPAATKP